jgi:serine/threonine-protein kinase RsbW
VPPFVTCFDLDLDNNIAAPVGVLIETCSCVRVRFIHRCCRILRWSGLVGSPRLGHKTADFSPSVSLREISNHPDSNCVVADPNRGNAHMRSRTRPTDLRSVPFPQQLAWSWFGTRIAHWNIAGSANPRRVTSAVLSVPVLRRRYVDDSNLRSHVEGAVSSAALGQGPELGGCPALWPVGGTWLIGGRIMNTASAVIDGSIASPKFGKMRVTSSSMTFEAWIPSEIEAISPLVDWLMQLIERSRCAAGNEPAVELALREALNNAVLHGNAMDAHKLVEVCCCCEWGRGVWLIVKDQGNGFDANAVPDALATDRLEAEHGRGICLMRLSMDQVLFERGGTEVRMWKGPAARSWRRKASQSRS